MRPGFGGMLGPRRQGHAGFASVTGAGVFSTPEGASVAGLGGPLHDRPKAS